MGSAAVLQHTVWGIHYHAAHCQNNGKYQPVIIETLHLDVSSGQLGFRHFAIITILANGYCDDNLLPRQVGSLRQIQHRFEPFDGNRRPNSTHLAHLTNSNGSIRLSPPPPYNLRNAVSGVVLKCGVAPMTSKGLQRDNFGIPLKVCLIKCQQFLHAMLDHHGHKPRVVRLLAFHCIFHNQGIPCIEYLRGFRQKIEKRPRAGDFPMRFLRGHAKAVITHGRVKTTYISYSVCGTNHKMFIIPAGQQIQRIQCRLSMGMILCAIRKGMFVSTRIINCPGINAIAAIVHNMHQRFMAIRPSVQCFKPGVSGRRFAFFQDNHLHLMPAQILAAHQLLPFAFDNSCHHAPWPFRRLLYRLCEAFSCMLRYTTNSSFIPANPIRFRAVLPGAGTRLKKLAKESPSIKTVPI